MNNLNVESNIKLIIIGSNINIIKNYRKWINN